jgi:hypothetical protein
MVNRPERQHDGLYHIKGKTYPELIGSRRKVWNGTAFKTHGQLHRSDLMMSKKGEIVSKKKHFTAKREKRLEKAGYKAKKGAFKLFTRKNR